MMGALALAGMAVAAELNVGPGGGSTVTATIRQAGVEVESPFTKFSGRIVYDAGNVAGASAVVEVETGSFDFGDEAYNAEVRKKSWFDSTAFPKAKFQSTSIKPGTPGSFVATGQLTLKGRVQTVSVPVKVTATGGRQVFDGSFAISRKAFAIGDPAWEDTVDDKVTLKFHLVGGR
jgi:polyisoprenoid-binding protein YceI